MVDVYRLFYRRGIYQTEATDSAFTRAMLENVEHHRTHCPEYALLLEAQGYRSEEVRSVADLHLIPPLPTLFLKKHPLSSADQKLLFHSTTSGTSGAVTQMGFDWASARKGLGMVLGTFFAHKLISLRPTNYIVLGYQPTKRNRLGAVKTAYATTYAAPALHREYALRDNGADYELNLEGLKETLVGYAQSGHPVRFMGFPAYFMFLLRELRQDGIQLRLHPKSMVMLAGGWKQFYTEEVDKGTLYAMSEETLGLGGSHFQEFFGAVEHPVIYADCSNHHFHVPTYSRVIIRDAEFVPVPFGTPGILNLLTPMITSMPFSSVMTDDLAVMRPGQECGCGIQSPFFEILGRVGLSDIKTCAVGAGELLSVVKGVGR